jgi:hypothetical protein
MTLRRYVLLSALMLTTAQAAPAIAWAQDAIESVDPPDTVYHSGLEEMDSATLRALPVNPAFRAFIPVSTDLSFLLPPPGNQGNAGSCTAWAVAYAARSYYTGALEHRDLSKRMNIPSPNYVYTLARQLQNKPVCKQGSSAAAVVAVLKQGALSLADYPYHGDDCDQPPPASIVAKANDFRVTGMSLINTKRLDDVKGVLAQSNPLFIEFHDSPSFQKFRGDGIYNDTTADKDMWHAIAVVGYDDRKQAFRLINSWGTGWGDHGYAWISYDVFSARVRLAGKLDVAKPAAVRTEMVNPDELRPPAPVVVVPPVVPPPAPKPQITEVRPPAPPSPSPVVVPPAPKPQMTEVEPPEPQPIPAPQPAPLPPAPAPLQPPPRKADLSELDRLSCAKVTALQQDGRTLLSGFVGSEADLGLLRRVAADMPGTAVRDVIVAPWPQCEILLTLSKPLDQAATPKIDLGSGRDLRRGDLMRVAIQSPPQITYLYVSYIQADGTVVNLVQPEGFVPAQTLPNQTLVFGDGVDGRPKFEVSAPYGSEMIVTIASRSPLFDTPLPQQQTEREYMSALRRALIYKPSPDMPDREVSASIAIVETHER